MDGFELGHSFELHTFAHMPDFDSTLLTLMGISGGTYVGLKIPEKQ